MVAGYDQILVHYGSFNNIVVSFAYFMTSISLALFGLPLATKFVPVVSYGLSEFASCPEVSSTELQQTLASTCRA